MCMPLLNIRENGFRRRRHLFSFRMCSHLDNTCTTASSQGQFHPQLSTTPEKMSNRPTNYIWLQFIQDVG